MRTLQEDQERAGPVRTIAARPPTTSARWRSVLESRWRDRLQRLTDVCLAFYEAGNQALARQPHRPLPALMREAVQARHELRETDEALARLSSGRFGQCEDCAGAIPVISLLHAPELRYCPACAV